MIELKNKESKYLNSNNIEKAADNDLLNHALHYASLGFLVIPLHNIIFSKGFKRCSCSEGTNCRKPGKHPRTWKGHKDATTNPDIILKWWTNSPDANIGIVTGKKTGIFVLDIDYKYGGEYSLEELKDDYRNTLKDYYDCEGTLTAYTGSGGRHLIYKHPIYEIKSSESIIGLGLDIKGEESYIVAPPSNHWSGGTYYWHGVNTEITEAAGWLIHEILTSSEKLIVSKNNYSKETFGGKISNGNRNSYLSRQARGLVNSHSEKVGRKILLKKNIENFDNPLPEKEVDEIVKKTWKKFGKFQNRDGGI